ncbi:MAG: hypothetical protein RLZZ136_1617 [Pseudomonadota bacterium]
MAKTPSSTPSKAKPATKTAAKPKAAPKSAPKKSPVKAQPVAETKAKFAKALDEARAGAQALATQAQDKAGLYRERLVDQSEAWLDDAKAYGSQAKEKAAEIANEGKVMASEAIAGLGQVVADTAPTIDEKLGKKYGDYARSAARTMQESAANLEAKELGELGNDAREFVKKSPGVAVGIAAVAGFFLARLFRGNKADEG